MDCSIVLTMVSIIWKFVGRSVGCPEGSLEGASDGRLVGCPEGSADGSEVGAPEG